MSQPPQLNARAILFDLDGTLSDSSAVVHEAYKTTLEKNSLLYDKARIDEMVGMGLAHIYQELAKGHTIKNKDLIRQHREFFHTREPIIPLFEGVREMLDKLAKEAMLMGVVTSAGRGAIERAIIANGIDHYFGAFVTADDVRNLKPHPEPIEKCMEDLGAMPADCIFVGDSIYDMQAAKAAGTRTVAVTWGYGERANLEATGPDAIVETMEELQATLADMLGIDKFA